MKIKTSRVPLFAAVALICCFSVAFGEEEPVCDAKGPCCDLDWTGQGATIVKIKAAPGQALVSQSPWVQASVGTRVEHGGRVMCADNCQSILVAYDDGCWYELKENEMLTIEDVSPCCAAVIPPPVVVAEPLGLGWVPVALAAICAGTDCLADRTTIELPPDIPPPPPPPPCCIPISR